MTVSRHRAVGEPFLGHVHPLGAAEVIGALHDGADDDGIGQVRSGRVGTDLLVCGDVEVVQIQTVAKPVELRQSTTDRIDR
jgi:hypothetical protein